MAAAITTTRINAGQLGVELGRVPLRVVGPHPDGSYVVRAGNNESVDQAALEAAIAAHAANSGWTDPNPPPATPEQQRAARLEQLRAKGAAAMTPAERNEAIDLLLGR